MIGQRLDSPFRFNCFASNCFGMDRMGIPEAVRRNAIGTAGDVLTLYDRNRLRTRDSKGGGMNSGSINGIGRALPLLALLALAGCTGEGILAPVGPIGAGERTILLNSLVIMLVIVIPTIIATLGFAWWFRAGNTKARYLPEWAFSGRVELVVWSIPILVILFLAGVIWVGSHDLDPFKPIKSREKALEVQVVSLDWKWLFIYPDQGIASVNELVVPAGVPVHFSLTSASVMNAFFVHRVGSMIYTMNGMVTQVNL